MAPQKFTALPSLRKQHLLAELWVPIAHTYFHYLASTSDIPMCSYK